MKVNGKMVFSNQAHSLAKSFIQTERDTKAPSFIQIKDMEKASITIPTDKRVMELGQMTCSFKEKD